VRVTVTSSIFVRRPPTSVWDFTQDFACRPDWDAGVLEAEVIRREPVRLVRVRCAGGLRGVFRYVRFEPPRHASVALDDVRSVLVEGGGGAWSYEAEDGGTRWTQTNSLVLRAGWWRRALAPLVRRQLDRSTRRAMRTAKALLESAAGGPAP
jgi:hypothetical protein